MSVFSNLNNNKTHGPDGIPARLLIETSSQIAPSLCSLFNKSLRCGVLPDDWKLANIVPVHKRDEKYYVENYRPIPLLPLIAKVLERCIFHHIKHHVFQQINPIQHGFVPRKSCTTQLFEVFEQIGRKLDDGKQMDVIYLDSNIATFADDTKIFRTINNISDALSLQEDLTTLEENSSKVNLILNAQNLRTTRKHQKIEYPCKLHVVLESTAHERDLGVWTSSNLTWTKHVEEQCIQSTKMLGYIRRSTLDIKNISVRRTLY